ncbi:MAG: ABC transporter ATP-binding protein [Bdellovibrionaceae bacterium]|jgi:ABC-2 type transport system ATP-binding protein|nr:ABC transporter ATP-binding protein [Pseudobdellovibrionaceae bacterium]
MILSINNLKKYYGDLKAVDGVSFHVEEGICFGLLGPNGAGKSTTLEILEGVKEETSGEILFQGLVRDKSYKQRIGIQFQSTALQDHMTIEEALYTFQSFYEKTMSIDRLIELCNLQEILHKEHRRVSGGQRQRLLLALSLINDPEIIFLDEPTTGLDPYARIRYWELINDIKKLGKTIILTTHYMDEAHSLCDELIIMDRGKIIAQGSPAELLEIHFKERTLILPESEKTALEKSDISFNEVKGKLHILSTDVKAHLRQLMEVDISLDDIEVRSQNLEDLFIQLTGSTF